MIKLNGQSCSSQGYRMAETQSECEDIATHLGLLETSAEGMETEFSPDCANQSYYRCAYYPNWPTLYWYPNCADNEKDQDNSENLCVQRRIP